MSSLRIPSQYHTSKDQFGDVDKELTDLSIKLSSGISCH